MQNSFTTSNYYLNATYQANSMAAQREGTSILLHPYSQELKLQQINSLRQKGFSKTFISPLSIRPIKTK